MVHCVLQRAEEARQHRALVANLLGRLLQTARLPEVTLVVHLAQNPDPLGLVQERNDAQVAAQKIGQPPQRGSLA